MHRLCDTTPPLYLRPMHHEHYMLRCLELARKGLGYTRSNPLVGAVIVVDDRVIGEGYHAIYGGPHAEVNAIASVQDQSLLAKATLYVNLEPCSHYGKTPPCSDLILEHGIRRVVYGMQDPFALVSGRGLERLRNHGVEVIGPVLETECKALNQRFLCRVLQQRPWILLKWAQSSDGFMDIERQSEGLGSYAISGPAAQALVHQWRGQESAILIGVQTAINDRPQLSVRYAAGPQPLRIVLDPKGRLPLDHPMRLDGLPLLMIQEGNPQESDEHILYTPPPFELRAILQALLDRGIASIMIEGGRHTLQSWIDLHLWDEARVFTAPHTLGKGLQAPVFHREAVTTFIAGEDLCSVYRRV